ncbi:Maltose O-acetyltransferase [Streptococcus gordonii]|uniref:Acetyltransferase n=1 Tax=Streptococcus gordonii TaxID=1302 RepID=A0A139MWW0_STRGN|nr:Maltose O-acetyltransferase [Streptococcus gordonii]
MTSEYQKMIAGHYYLPGDPELRQLAQESRRQQYAFNQEQDAKKRTAIIQSWFGSTGQHLHMETNFCTDYGINIHVGEYFYANWNLTMLDVCPITIGNNAMIGPNCQFLTPLHPLNPEERNSGIEYGAPITIGDNFWAGGGVTVLPGVTLRDNVVAGAGAVITKSFGDNVVLAGNPTHVIKTIPVKEKKQ